MNLQDLDRIESLFHAAKVLEGVERDDYLEQACRDRPDLRADVENLLRADKRAQAENFLDRSIEPPRSVETPRPITIGSALANPSGSDDPHLLLGKRVGPYKVERYLGGGGMGDVYLAVRQAPFKILVALKILRRGIRTEEILRRFDVERQILASLNHPNIAKLLDGGVTDDGHPYFAMEYVDGLPITLYADRNRLSIDDRLKLFREVCLAVDYAHRNLVIHRDLKPPNILVTSEGAVKLLDFGIAKIINQNLADLATPVTQTRYRMLTPDYASPEQVRAESLSTASDVYSLGVILFELLSGSRPYRLEGLTAAEIERAVCETAHDPPSRCIADRLESHDADTNSSAPLARQLSHEKLARVLSGELDNIAMMALRKEPGRRYQSVEKLTADIDNHAVGRPIYASPDSRLYRVRKFVRRNAGTVASAVVIGLMLAGFAVYNSVQAQKLAQERDRVQTEAQKANQVSEFVVRLFNMADPTSAPGDSVTVRSLLEKGVERADAELSDQPALQAELFGVIARAFENLGRNDEAVGLLQRAVDLRRQQNDDERALLNDLRVLATLTASVGRVDESAAAYNEFISRGSVLLGPEHPEVLLERMYLLSLTHVVQPQAGADSILAIWDRLDPVVDQLSDPEAAAVLGFVSDLYYTQNEFAAAERVALRAIDASSRAYGETNVQNANMYTRLGWIYVESGQPQKAFDASVNAIALSEQLHPDGHRSLAESYGLQGEALSAMGRYDEAEVLLVRDLEMIRSLLGEKHFAVGRPLRLLAKMYRRKGDIDKAIEYNQAGVDIIVDRFGPDYIIARQYQLTVAELLIEKGDYDRAEAMLLDTYTLFVETRGEENGSTIEVAGILSRLYEQMGRPDESSRYAARAKL